MCARTNSSPGARAGLWPSWRRANLDRCQIGRCKSWPLPSRCPSIEQHHDPSAGPVVHVHSGRNCTEYAPEMRVCTFSKTFQARFKTWPRPCGRLATVRYNCVLTHFYGDNHVTRKEVDDRSGRCTRYRRVLRRKLRGRHGSRGADAHHKGADPPARAVLVLPAKPAHRADVLPGPLSRCLRFPCGPRGSHGTDLRARRDPIAEINVESVLHSRSTGAVGQD